MSIICPVCRNEVIVHLGYIVRHGTRIPSGFKECSGSGSSYLCIEDSCCG